MGEKKKMTTMTETYLWSALITLGGFVMILYFWLQPVIHAKLKYLLTGGQGTIDIASDGSIRMKVQNTNRNDCVNIRGRDKTINPNFKQFKFLGIPCHLFVPAVPSNVDLKFNQKKLTKEQQKRVDEFNEEFKTNLDVFEGRFDYNGIPDRDIDTLISNMTKDPLRELWLKYRNYLLYIGVFILLALIGLFAWQYKNHEILQTCGSVGKQVTMNVVGAN